MRIFKIILPCILYFSSLYAIQPQLLKEINNTREWNFAENKGQLSNENPAQSNSLLSQGTHRQRGTAINQGIKYYGHQGGVYLYCQAGKISFVFTKVDKELNQISEASGQNVSDVGVQNSEPLHRKHANQTTVITNCADLNLLNSNPNAQIIAADKQDYYENFYLPNTPQEGITRVNTYKKITYKDIYPHIDMVLYAMASGLKYEFTIYPGGNPDNIQMQWNGLENIRRMIGSTSERAGHTEYILPLGKIEESGLRTLQGNIPIKSSFIQKSNRTGFRIASYDRTKTLTIDPVLTWGTYFNGNNGYDKINIDGSNNIYLSGNTTGNIFTTSGAYQTSLAGAQNMFIAKFNPDGKLLWFVTYYGGNRQDWDNGVAIDISGNIFIKGATTSNSGIATRGAYPTLNGTFSHIYCKIQQFWYPPMGNLL